MDFRESLMLYFRGEKSESFAILAAACMLVASGLILIAWISTPFAAGLGSVLITTGMIGGLVGTTIVWRTDRQVAELIELYESDRQGFTTSEGSRIDSVVRSFRTYKIAYAVAALAGLVLLAASRSEILHGIAVGLLIFSGLGITVDRYAEARARRYSEAVRAQAIRTTTD